MTAVPANARHLSYTHQLVCNDTETALYNGCAMSSTSFHHGQDDLRAYLTLRILRLRRHRHDNVVSTVDMIKNVKGSPIEHEGDGNPSPSASGVMHGMI